MNLDGSEENAQRGVQLHALGLHVASRLPASTESRKAGKFKPEHAGQLSFHLTTVDAQVKAAEDAPTIGLLLCKRVVAATVALGGRACP